MVMQVLYIHPMHITVRNGGINMNDWWRALGCALAQPKFQKCRI